MVLLSHLHQPLPWMVITTFLIVAFFVFTLRQFKLKTQSMANMQKDLHTLHTTLQQFVLTDQQFKQSLPQHFTQQLTLQQTAHMKAMHQQMDDVRKQMQMALMQHGQTLEKPLQQLTQNVEKRLTEITDHVDKQLSGGFEKTNTIFTQVIERLSKIDAAQQRISELSNHVVDLQTLLADKRSRGAFGEIQLEHILKNALPSQHFSLQHTLANGKRADCLLILPKPTGNTVVDAKFPLESFKAMLDQHKNPAQHTLARQQFQKDIRHHIDNIADKYILPPETSDGAIMFLPAEAIFAEIHANFPDIVRYSQQRRVWLTSPTTLMAILTTASAVIKDVATRQQVHIIQNHLAKLGQDFQRFQKRMDALNKHIHLAQKDVDMVHTSSKKITNRFFQIEQVQLDATETSETSRIEETSTT